MRYWSSGRLKKRKVRNLVRFCGMLPHKALLLWEQLTAGRKKRAP